MKSDKDDAQKEVNQKGSSAPKGVSGNMTGDKSDSKPESKKKKKHNSTAAAAAKYRSPVDAARSNTHSGAGGSGDSTGINTEYREEGGIE